MTHQARSLELELPWPPSVNPGSYWGFRVIPNRKRNGPRYIVQTYITERGEAYRAAVRACFAARPETMTGRVAVRVDAYPPDRRVRDLDNIGKAVFDALTYCAVWDDDSQIDEITIRRRAITPGGRLTVTITEMSGHQQKLPLEA